MKDRKFCGKSDTFLFEKNRQENRVRNRNH